MNPIEAAMKVISEKQLEFAETGGEIAYLGYGEFTGWKNFQGNPMPTWSELPEPIRAAWEASSETLVRELSRRLRWNFQPKTPEGTHGGSAPST